MPENIGSQKIRRLLEIIRQKGMKKAVIATKKFMAHKWNERKQGLLLSWLKLRSKNGLVLKEMKGSRMYLDTSDPGISRELILSGVREELATKVLRQELKKGDGSHRYWCARILYSLGSFNCTKRRSGICI